MIKILYEDNAILVCVKPAGVPTQTAKITEKDMVSELNIHLKKQNPKAGQVYVIHRLDREVKGVLVFAKTKSAAASLSKQIQDKIINKHYMAYVDGLFDKISNEYVLLENYLYKDSKESKAVVIENATAIAEDVKQAKLEYRIEELFKDENRSLLEINLLTGRFHQIRAQLSNIGHPISNDIKYGGTKCSKYRRNEIGLVAYKLEFEHPESKEQMSFEID